MLKDGNLYYKADDGNYHKLVRIKNLEESIMAADDKLFPDDNDIGSIRNLKTDGYFEAKIDATYAGKFCNQIEDHVRELIQRHVEYTDLMWICELAIRYLKEHSRICSDDYEKE